MSSQLKNIVQLTAKVAHCVQRDLAWHSFLFTHTHAHTLFCYFFFFLGGFFKLPLTQIPCIVFAQTKIFSLFALLADVCMTYTVCVRACAFSANLCNFEIPLKWFANDVYNNESRMICTNAWMMKQHTQHTHSHSHTRSHPIYLGVLLPFISTT